MSVPRVSHIPSGDQPRKFANAINYLLGKFPKQAAIADLTVTATSGTLPTANGSVTIANAATPTVTELLEYCRELEAKIEALLAAQRALGLIES